MTACAWSPDGKTIGASAYHLSIRDQLLTGWCSLRGWIDSSLVCERYFCSTECRTFWFPSQRTPADDVLLSLSKELIPKERQRAALCLLETESRSRREAEIIPSSVCFSASQSSGVPNDRFDSMGYKVAQETAVCCGESPLAESGNESHLLSRRKVHPHRYCGSASWCTRWYCRRGAREGSESEWERGWKGRCFAEGGIGSRSYSQCVALALSCKTCTDRLDISPYSVVRVLWHSKINQVCPAPSSFSPMLTIDCADSHWLVGWIITRPLLAPHFAQRSDSRNHPRPESSSARRFRDRAGPTHHHSSFTADVQGGLWRSERGRTRWKAETRKGQNGSGQDAAPVTAGRGTRSGWSSRGECYAACCAGDDERERSRRCTLNISSSSCTD